MENFDTPWDDHYEIDPELWFQALLAITGDEARKEKTIAAIMKKTGFPAEKVEVIITSLMSFLATRTRVN